MISATRPLGATGFDLTTVGFGAWATGGGGWSFGWGPQDDEASIAAIRRAVESGVNWVDTAAIYGLGHSEEVVAEALAPFSDADRPYVFTKCGLRWDDGDPMAPARRVGRPESIRWEVEQSLRRLQVEGIDLYQMHWTPEDGAPVEDYWGTMLELKAEGVVAAVGLSNHTVEEVSAASRIGHVDSLQPPLSLINREAAGGLVSWCAEHHTGVIAYSPMQSGLLTGSFSRARVEALAPDDWRARNPNFTGEGLERNLALAEALRPIAERHGVTPAAVAVAWVLAWPGVTGAIVGARSPEQVDSWVAAADLELPAADLDELARAISATRAGSGPARPPAPDSATRS
ncbi:MAG TPA: aldo/keto reductase [Actinomycetota bacterium]|nr:aldo/keto reductase [Actinomycetota bacterium]